MLQARSRLADSAAKLLDKGVWPDRIADEFMNAVIDLTREEAMLAVQQAIRQGAGRNQKLYNPKAFLTDDINLFYSHSLQ